jgi:hypothetical protein
MQRDIYGASVTFDPHTINNQVLHVLYRPLASPAPESATVGTAANLCRTCGITTNENVIRTVELQSSITMGLSP